MANKIAPSSSERLRIIAQNMDQRVLNTRTGFTGALTSIDLMWGTATIYLDPVFRDIDGRKEHACMESFVVLLKKPLGNISKEDAMEAMILQGFKNTNNFSIKTMLDCIEWDDGNECGRVFFKDLKYSAAEFLRLQGYALPYGQWSVDELVEFGIYKIN